MNRRRNRGVALLTALMVLALASLLAYGLLQQGNLAIDRASGNQRAAQASALADGLFEYALIALIRDRPESDYNDEAWAQPLPALPVPQGLVTGSLADLNGRINVNGFASNETRKAFTRNTLTRLLVNLGRDPKIATRIEDAIDADDASLGGGEDVDFMAARPSSRAPNRPLIHLNELRNLPRLSAEDFDAIAPFLCAINTDATLNINTASWQVLMSLSDQISEDLAKKLWAEGRANHASVSEFVVELVQSGGPSLQESQIFLDVKSSRFIARARIQLNQVDYRYIALLNRRNSKVEWRMQGDF